MGVCSGDLVAVDSCCRWLAGLAWACALLPVAMAQTVDGTGLVLSDQGTPSLKAPDELMLRMDQIWEAEVLMGQAMPPGEQPVRLLQPRQIQLRAAPVEVVEGDDLPLGVPLPGFQRSRLRSRRIRQ